MNNEVVTAAVVEAQDSINEAMQHADRIPVDNPMGANAYYAIQALANACKHLVDAVSNLEAS